MKQFLGRLLIPLCALAVLHPAVPSGAALVLGIALALVLGNPYSSRTKQITPRLLQASVVGLGAGMNLVNVAKAGMNGIVYTFVSIAGTLLLGLALGRLLRTSRDSSLLITVGTAVCGGSAIAAVAPVIRAKSHDVSIALGTVFLLNAVGLLVFPALGHRFGLGQDQFGLWSALAIHDTSSVVGATLQYGARALEVGTTVKLARALWIVPLTFGVAQWRSRSAPNEEGADVKPKRPWFILGFVLAAAIVTWIPALQPAGQWVEGIARRSLVLTLFLIGSGLTLATLKEVGMRPFVQGVLLWALVGSISLGALVSGRLG